MQLQTFKNFVSFVVTPLVLMTACGQQGAVFDILPTGQSFQGAITSNKIDVLWVVDNSGSMLTKQQNLATSFNSFMNTFTQRNYDFRMAIITTDTRAVPTGQNGNFQGTPTVIDNSTANFETTFQANVVVGATGDAAAKGLDAINLALSPAKLAGTNTGFVRNNSKLIIIILSDADDNDSTATAASTIAFLDSLRPDTVDESTGRLIDNYSVNVVIDNQASPGPVACVGSEDGIKFRELANLSGGSIMDICAADFSSGLTQLSENIAQFVSQVLLKSEPQVSTLQVIVDGVNIPQNATNGYSYVASGNKIVFNGSAIPTQNSVVSVTYTPTDIIR